MPTPAPHTPVVIVKAGGAAIWSAACIKALTEAGFQPDDFGDYNHVASRCGKARQKCSAYDRARANARGETLNPPWNPAPAGTDNPSAPRPSDHERFLAGSQSGHITQHATQSTDRTRNNPCGNVVDGWNPQHAPCMPHHGSASQDGTMHCEITRMEQNQPRTARPPNEPALNNNHDYSDERRRRDERERIDKALEMRGEQAPDGTPRTDGGNATTPADSAPNANQGDPNVDGSGGGDADGKKDGSGDPTAGDCIEAFNEAGLATMKSRFEDRGLSEENAATADGGPNRTAAQGQAHRDQLKEDAATAQTDYMNAAAAQGGAQRSLDAAERRLGDASTPAERRQAARDVAAARTTLTERQQARDSARQARDVARNASNAAEGANCRREQAIRMRQGRDGGTSRCPGRNPNLPENRHGGSGTSGGTSAS